MVVNADSTGLRQLTDTPTNELTKSWSLDGKSLVGDFSTPAPSGKPPAKCDVAVRNFATGAMTLLTNSGGRSEPSVKARGPSGRAGLERASPGRDHASLGRHGLAEREGFEPSMPLRA